MRPAPGMIENAILNTWSATFLTIRNFKLPRFPVMTGTAAGADPSGGCASAILIRTGAPWADSSGDTRQTRTRSAFLHPGTLAR